MKKSPTSKLWRKLTKGNPILSNLVDPDDLLKAYPNARKLANLASDIALTKEKNKPAKRRYFTKLTKEKTLEAQNYRCKLCGNKSDVWDFDHIDGNPANNSLSNCQALCPNCHAKKTRKKL